MIPPKPKIAIIEQDPTRRDYFRKLISAWGYLPFSFEKDVICLDNMLPLDPDLIIVSRLPVQKIYRFVNTLKTVNYALPVLIMPYQVEIDQFIKSNGFDDVSMIKNSIDGEGARAIVESFLNGSPPENGGTPSLVIGQSPEMLKIKNMLVELSHTRETVLIKGARGTGKEHVARALHQLSSPANNSFFIKVNSAELTHRLLETRLFGDRIDKSLESMPGKEASGKMGTVFFDSIEEMSLSVQGNLLYFLESGTSKFFSTENTCTADYRIIASAGEDIEKLVTQKKFRNDLYFRLNSIDMRIPALKDRREDVPLLADFFADKGCMESGRSYFDLPEKIKHIFLQYHWPLNVEELEQRVKRAVIFGGESGVIKYFAKENNKDNQLDDFYQKIGGFDGFSDACHFVKDSGSLSLKEITKEYIAHTEKIYMKKALDQTNWNRKKAAKKLRISYKSLLNKISEYNLS